MERKIKREKSVPAFVLDTEDLERLTQEIFRGFDSQHAVVRIKIKNNLEDLAFSSVKELRELGEFKGMIKGFTFDASDYAAGRSLYLWLPSDESPRVVVTGEDVIWVAGILEVVARFLSKRARWYAPVWRVPVLLLMALTLAGPMLSHLATWYFFNKSYPSLALVFFAVFMFTALRAKLFPRTTLIVSEPPGWLKRNHDQVIAISALLTLLVTTIGVLWSILKPT